MKNHKYQFSMLIIVISIYVVLILGLFLQSKYPATIGPVLQYKYPILTGNNLPPTSKTNSLLVELRDNDSIPSDAVLGPTVPNHMMTFDLDGDQIVDHVMIDNNILIFGKGHGEGTFELEKGIYKIKRHINAYNFLINKQLPDIIIWDETNKAHIYQNQGTNGALNILTFGCLEDQ